MPKPNTEGRVLLALDALQEDPELRARRAAEMYQVHSRTLQRCRKVTRSQRIWAPKQPKLSDLEEDILVWFILTPDS